MLNYGISRGTVLRHAISCVRFALAFVVAYYLSFVALSTLLFWPSSTVGVLTFFGFSTLFAGLFTSRRGSMERLGAYTIAVMLLFAATALVTLVLVASLGLLGIDWQSPIHTVLPSVWASRLESVVVLAFAYAGAYYLVYRGGYSTLKRRVEDATAD